MITIYTTHCPKCEQLKNRLNDLNIEFKEFDDVEAMIMQGLSGSMPKLELEDGKILEFAQAWKWAIARQKEMCDKQV